MISKKIIPHLILASIEGTIITMAFQLLLLLQAIHQHKKSWQTSSSRFSSAIGFGRMKLHPVDEAIELINFRNLSGTLDKFNGDRKLHLTTALFHYQAGWQFDINMLLFWEMPFLLLPIQMKFWLTSALFTEMISKYRFDCFPLI